MALKMALSSHNNLKPLGVEQVFVAWPGNGKSTHVAEEIKLGRPKATARLHSVQRLQFLLFLHPKRKPITFKSSPILEP